MDFSYKTETFLQKHILMLPNYASLFVGWKYVTYLFLNNLIRERNGITFTLIHYMEAGWH